MLDSIFDLPLIIAGPVIVGSLCLFAIGGLLLVRRHVLPRPRIHHEDATRIQGMGHHGRHTPVRIAGFKTNDWQLDSTAESETMKNHLRSIFWLALLVVFSFACASLQAQTFQFLPEIDSYLKVDPMVRVYFQAKDDREGGDPLQATIGPSVQFFLKPLVKLKKVSAFDLDDAKKRPLVFEIGYRYITAPTRTPKTAY
jgi:hypothetical protein